jgi:small subunit ribosomal protein S35
MSTGTTKKFNELFLYKQGRKTMMQTTLDILFKRTDNKKLSKTSSITARLMDKKPRALEQSTDQDWTSVWPAAQSFRYSVVPLPVRMGFVSNSESKVKLPRAAYANLELMKIPNFLHLTPHHIQKHCNAIKKFCSKFPEELKEIECQQKFFPLEFRYSDYIHQGTNIRDMRARQVTMGIRLDALELDTHANLKLRQLVGDRYNKDTNVLTITSDRCPTRKQNREYSEYLLTVLYHESNKTERWEADFIRELQEKHERHPEHSESKAVV